MKSYKVLMNWPTVTSSFGDIRIVRPRPFLNNHEVISFSTRKSHELSIYTFLMFLNPFLIIFQCAAGMPSKLFLLHWTIF